VAKNRSSRGPIRSRTTPMNQRNAIPANGTRCNARTTRRPLPGSASTAAASPGPEGAASRRRTSTAVSRSAKSTPAIPAARGVRSERFTTASWSTRLIRGASLSSPPHELPRVAGRAEPAADLDSGPPRTTETSYGSRGGAHLPMFASASSSATAAASTCSSPSPL
jgi:hypothetical protein